MSIVKKAFSTVSGALGLSPQVNIPENKVPAQQLTRTPETGVEDVTIGTEDTSNVAKGKRQLLRPVSSNGLGGV